MYIYKLYTYGVYSSVRDARKFRRRNYKIIIQYFDGYLYNRVATIVGEITVNIRELFTPLEGSAAAFNNNFRHVYIYTCI